MMNKVKWLSLLLAGMVAASMLAACAEFEATDLIDAGTAESGETTDGSSLQTTGSDAADVTTSAPLSTTTAPLVTTSAPALTTTAPAATTTAPLTTDPDTPSGSTGLMPPSKLTRTLLTAEDATVRARYKGSDGAIHEVALEKDGNTVRLTDGAGSTEQVTYYDLGGGMRYDQQDGAWYKTADADGWFELLEALDGQLYGILLTPIDTNFVYKTSVDEYQMSASALTAFGLSSVALRYTESTAVHGYVIVDENNVISSVDVAFTVSEALSLPHAQNASGTTESLLSPSALYQAIAGAEDITITATLAGQTSTYTKDGDKLLLHYCTDTDTLGESVYIDLATGEAYMLDADGKWISDSGYTWESILLLIGMTAEADIFIDAGYESFGANDKTLTMLGSTADEYVQLERSETRYEVVTLIGGELGLVDISFDETRLVFPSFN